MLKPSKQTNRSLKVEVHNQSNPTGEKGPDYEIFEPKIKMANPPHPAELLEEIMSGHQFEEVAKGLGIENAELQTLLTGKVPFTEEIALRISKCFQTSSEMWLRLQSQYDEWNNPSKPRG